MEMTKRVGDNASQKEKSSSPFFKKNSPKSSKFRKVSISQQELFLELEQKEVLPRQFEDNASPQGISPSIFRKPSSTSPKSKKGKVIKEEPFFQLEWQEDISPFTVDSSSEYEAEGESLIELSPSSHISEIESPVSQRAISRIYSEEEHRQALRKQKYFFQEQLLKKDKRWCEKLNELKNECIELENETFKESEQQIRQFLDEYKNAIPQFQSKIDTNEQTLEEIMNLKIKDQNEALKKCVTDAQAKVKKLECELLKIKLKCANKEIRNMQRVNKIRKVLSVAQNKAEEELLKCWKRH